MLLLISEKENCISLIASKIFTDLLLDRSTQDLKPDGTIN